MKWRLIITLVWIGLLALLVARNVLIPKIDTDLSVALAKAREESFYGVWFNNQRIGYVENRVQSTSENRYALTQRAHLRLNVLNQTRQIDMHLNANLNERQQLQDFTFSFRSPFYVMEAQGAVLGKTLHLLTDTGGDQRKETIILAAAPFISTNQRAYLLKPLPQTGQKLKIPYFDPLTLNSRETVVTYLGEKKVLIKKRIHRLHHFESRFSGVRINFWLDDKGKVIKEESPAGFVFLDEPKFRAVDIEAGTKDLLRAVAVSFSGELPGDLMPAAIEYRIDLPAEAGFELNGGRQQYQNGVLRLTRETLSTGRSGPAEEADCDDPDAISASRFVQADHADIVTHSQTIAPDSNDTLQTVQALAAWVYANLDKRPVIGLPDALTTLRNRKGDCNEHAALFAALARSRGIPARIAAGVTLHQERFYYHAWNEVCIEGRWLSLDTTKNQIPADLTHIRLVTGDLEDQLRIGAALGKLRLEILGNRDQ